MAVQQNGVFMHHFHGSFGGGGFLLLVIFVVAIALALSTRSKGDL
jgi:hypothetical protein